MTSWSASQGWARSDSRPVNRRTSPVGQVDGGAEQRVFHGAEPGGADVTRAATSAGVPVALVLEGVGRQVDPAAGPAKKARPVDCGTGDMQLRQARRRIAVSSSRSLRSDGTTVDVQWTRPPSARAPRPGRAPGTWSHPARQERSRVCANRTGSRTCCTQ